MKTKTSTLSELARRTGAPPISWLMSLALSHPKLISLAAGFTDNEGLPVDDVRDLIDDLLRSPKAGRSALQYGSTQGDPLLRELTAANIRRLDGGSGPAADRTAGRMIVTNGSQQLLYMATEALCDPGDIVLIEDPTYFVYLGIVQSHGLRVRAVPIERDGIDLAKLEQALESLKRSGALRRVKLLYVVSYFQNPTGVSMSYPKKAAALKLLRQYERAAGHPIYLLEDAAYRELGFSGPEVKSALAVPGYGDRVLYAGTYSKPFATGTRVGFGILPEPVFTAVLRIKGNHDFGTSNLLQQLIARALATGRYEKHLRALHARYRRKAAVMGRALRAELPSEVELWEPQGGLYYWARLPRAVRSGPDSKLFRAALARDVLYVPGELCYGDDPTRRKPDHEMRISFGGATEPNLRKGVARLGEALHTLIRR